MSSIITKFVANFFPSLKALKGDPKSISYTEETNPGYDPDSCEWKGGGEGYHRLRSMVCTFSRENYPSVYHMINTGKENNFPIININGQAKRSYSCGLHIYFIGRLCVTPEQACIIIDNLVAHLESVLPRKEGEPTWGQILSKNVYKRGKEGIKLPGACKLIDCDKCIKENKVYSFKNVNDSLCLLIDDFSSAFSFAFKNADSKKTKIQKKVTHVNVNNNRCNQCGGFGKIMIDNAYEPFCIINGDGEVGKFFKSFPESNRF